MDCLQNLRNERPAGTFVLAMVLEHGTAQARLNALNACHEAELKRIRAM